MYFDKAPRETLATEVKSETEIFSENNGDW